MSKKSNVLLFRGKNCKISRNINIVINGTQAEEKQDAKYLGVMLDNKLSYSCHIKHVKAKITKGNAILYKIRKYVPNSSLVNSYHAFIHSHINYGLNVWGQASKTQLAQVERQQRKSIRIMNFKNRKFKETDGLFKNSKILPLKLSRDLSSAKLLWQVSNSLLDSPINTLFESRPNGTFHVPFRGI